MKVRRRCRSCFDSAGCALWSARGAGPCSCLCCSSQLKLSVGFGIKSTVFDLSKRFNPNQKTLVSPLHSDSWHPLGQSSHDNSPRHIAPALSLSIDRGTKLSMNPGSNLSLNPDERSARPWVEAPPTCPLSCTWSPWCPSCSLDGTRPPTHW
jgi:hypothetical protein